MRLAGVLLCLVASREAAAEWRVGLGAGRITGEPPSQDIDGTAVRVGLEYRFHAAFGVGPELSVLQLAGVRDGAANSVRGLATTYVARWYALRFDSLAVYGMFGFGGVVFDAPFPANGTRLDGTSSWGGGLAIGLGERGWLRLEGRQVHSSNGKGLVPENPAYDGFEIGAHLVVAPSPLVERRHRLDLPPRAGIRPTRLELFFGARADGYSTLDEGGAVAGGVHASFEAGLSDRVATQLDVLAGGFSSRRSVTAATARVYYRDRETAVGASLGASAIEDRRAGETASLFVERYEHPTLLASAAAGYERKRETEDLWFAELVLHLYPSDRWLLRAGFSYVQAEIKQTRADILMHAEYALLTAGTFTIGGYLQYGGNLLTRGSLGLVLYFDRESYARRERTRGVHGLRFK